MNTPLSGFEHPSGDGFWAYVLERYQIAHRRYVLQIKSPEELTADTVLRKYHFCNVKREWDYGSRWLMQRGAVEFHGVVETVWGCVLYRLLNAPTIFQELEQLCGTGPIPTLDAYLQNTARIESAVLRLSRIGNPAYYTLTSRTRGSRRERLVSVLRTFAAEIPLMAESVLHASDMYSACRTLSRLPSIGPFAAFQVARDLVLLRAASWNEDYWCEVGPGAIPGLRYIFGRVSQSGLVEQVRTLQLSKPEFALSVPFLNLCDMEHNVCEYRKFVNVRSGEGHRRYYRPHQDKLLPPSLE